MLAEDVSPLLGLRYHHSATLPRIASADRPTISGDCRPERAVLAMLGDGVLVEYDDSESRFNRFKSARSSAADWYRRSRSFSNAFWSTSSILVGRSGFSRAANGASRFRIPSKITPVV